MSASAAERMVVRRMGFAFTPDMDRVFVKNDPEMSFMFLGAWIMLPYLEPYLIRTMRQALPRITSKPLIEELKRFCAQEGEHFKQHAKANDIIRALHPSYEALRPLEADLDETLKEFSRSKPLEFNLAYAEGFESMTSATSRAQLEVGLYDRTDSPLADLAKWHVMEELEHRCVAFDVYEHVHGSYFYRLRKGLWAQKHYFGWVKRFGDVLKAPEAELFERYESADLVAERKAFNSRYYRRALPRLLGTYMPWYNPAKADLPREYEDARVHYSHVAAALA